MKLANQCCSLEQSKELRKLGIIQDSVFYHFPNPNLPDIIKKYNQNPYSIVPGNDYLPNQPENIKTAVLRGFFKKTHSAFTVAELSVMLGDYFPSWSFNSDSPDRKWIATVITKSERPDGKNLNTENSFDRYAETQAMALAELLIATIKVGHLKVNDINERLLNS